PLTHSVGGSMRRVAPSRLLDSGEQSVLAHGIRVPGTRRNGAPAFAQMAIVTLSDQFEGHEGGRWAMRIVLTHGRDQAFQIGRTLERDWTDALNEGLTDVQGPASDRVRVDFAFYGSIWRPDRRAIAGDDTERGDSPARGEEADSTEGLPPSPFMSELTREILATQRGAPEPERLDFRRLVDLVGALDQAAGVSQVILTRFLKDLDE